MPRPYIDASREAGKAFYQQQIPGPVVLLNLLRFKEIADYSVHPELAPTNPFPAKPPSTRTWKSSNRYCVKQEEK